MTESNLSTTRVQINIHPLRNAAYQVSLHTGNLWQALARPPVALLEPYEVQELQREAQLIRQNFRSPHAVDPITLKGQGSYLFRTVLKAPLAEKLPALLALAGPENAAHIALSIPESLASVWWELLYSSPPPVNGFVGVAPTLHLSRYTGNFGDTYTPKPVEQLRILVITATPTDYLPVQAEKEVRLIRTALWGMARVDLQVVEDPTLQEFKALISHAAPHIMHFIGHAEFSPPHNSALIFRGSNGLGEKLSGAALTQMLRAQRPACQLVILNACETATIGQTYDSSLVGSLVQAGIPAVTGMQCAIPNTVALFFSQYFYASLLNGVGQPVDAAVSAARTFLYHSRLSRNLLRNYWCAPVLYTRSRDGRLFTLAEAVDTITPLRAIYALLQELSAAQVGGQMPQVVEQLRHNTLSALPGLALALNSDQQTLRLGAVQVLSALGGETATAILREHSQGADPLIVAEILAALARLEAQRPARIAATAPDSNPEHAGARKQEIGGILSHDRADLSPTAAPPAQQGTPPAADNPAVASATSPGPSQESPDLMAALIQQHRALLAETQQLLQATEKRVAAFRDSFGELRRDFNRCLRAGEQVLTGVAELKHWSQQQSLEGLTDPVTAKVAQINADLNRWRLSYPLRPQIYQLRAQYAQLELELRTEQTKFAARLQSLKALERQASHTDFWLTLRWLFQRWPLQMADLYGKLTQGRVRQTLADFLKRSAQTHTKIEEQLARFGQIEIQVVQPDGNRLTYQVWVNTPDDDHDAADV